jgi:cyclophilin family peptidyl-prolyl cis-trans isomerase
MILFMGSTLVSIGSIFLGNRNEKSIVVMETTKGTIEIELDSEKAEVTVLNFVSYVEDGFYNGTIFHRVIQGFMIQRGGFTQEGTEKPTKNPIALESDNGLKNLRDTIAMARTSVPDSATSQFFINLVDNEFLDRRPSYDGYAVFGKVVEGMDVVDTIGCVRTSPRGYLEDWPLEDITITKVSIKN